MPFNMRRLSLLSVLCAVTTAEQLNQQKSSLRKLQGKTQVPIGFQTGPDPGASYGGSIVYRPESRRIYITGSTYGQYFRSADATNANANANANVAADQSSCFVGIASIPAADNAEEPVKWLHAQQWASDVPEACNVIYVDNNPANLPENNTKIEEKMYLLGISKTNGMMEALRIESTFPAEQYGMILDMDVVDMSPSDSSSSYLTTTFWGGGLLQDGPVQYPIDMTMDEDGNIYVVSLQTFDSQLATKATRPEQVAKQLVNPSITPYGAEYNMLVEQFLYDNPGYDDGVGLPVDPSNVPIDTTIIDNWRKLFAPKNGSGGAIVAGIEYLGGLLIVVGSTNGHGEVFGNEIFTNSNKTDTSMDGFITKLIPETGSYYQFVVDNGAASGAAAQPAHKRSASGIASFTFGDDYIMGMCSSPADPDNFYVVGTTDGQIAKGVDVLVQGEIHAFVAKINLWTLLPAWIKQIGGNAVNKDVVRGMTCSVTDDAKHVYMAGVIENGGSFSLYNQNSFGKDDIFLFQANADDGSLVFLRQIGTSGNDRLAPGGLATDEFGNAILMGHTDGSFYRSRQFDQEAEKSNDLFIMTVMRGTGDYKEPEVEDASNSVPVSTDTTVQEEPVTEDPPVQNEQTETTENPVDAPSAAEGNPQEQATTVEPPAGQSPAEEVSGTESEPATFTPIGKEPNEPLFYTASGSVEHGKFETPKVQELPPQEGDERFGLLVFFSLLAMVGVAASLFAYHKMTKHEAVTDRDKVLEYLNEFDVDDIDLKKSATGGYHCSYTNDLAHGINARAVSREGLFGPMGFSGKTEDPLLAIHVRDPRAGGEIHFSDEPGLDRDDISSIGSGIGTPGRHSTHEDALVEDDDLQPDKEMII